MESTIAWGLLIVMVAGTVTLCAVLPRWLRSVPSEEMRRIGWTIVATMGILVVYAIILWPSNPVGGLVAVSLVAVLSIRTITEFRGANTNGE